jgi:predicted ATPase
LVIAGLESEFPALKSLDARPNNLPTALTSFVGRDREIAELEKLLPKSRLITLTGPGGTGKTRLALEMATRSLTDFRDGAFFVDLSPVADPALVPSAIATALGAQEETEGTPLDRVRDHLADKELLLWVDNFEHVTDALPAVGEILRATPSVKVLVTSRIALRLPGEQEFPVPPLLLPDPASLPDLASLSQFEAVALFVDRARGVRPDFEVTNESAPAVAEICARLDGLPLAIELAASRVRLLSPQEILPRLERRLALLISRSPHVAERQRTLRGAIAWSYDVLDEPERRLFAQMSAFAGGATVDAVQAVIAPNGATDALERLSSLVEKSLLRRTESAAGESRFTMLETIREFAAERLEEEGAQETTRRHGEFFLTFAEEAGPHLTAQDQAGWLDRCEREHDNIRTALRWAIDSRKSEIALRIGAALWRFWQQRGHLREASRWLDEALAIPGAPRDSTRAEALIAAGGLAYWRKDYLKTERHYTEALEIYRLLGDRRGEMHALYNAAFIPLMTEGDTDRAIALNEEVRSLARELGDRAMVGQASGAIGYARFIEGDYEGAAPPLEESLALSRELGDLFHEADDLVSLGQVNRMSGAFDRAWRYYSEGLVLLRQAGNLPMIVSVLQQLSALSAAEGNHEKAARLWGAASAAEERIGGAAPRTLSRVGDPAAEAAKALGRDAVEALVAEGRAMDLEKALAYALES